jgi:hypothetical protein
MLELATLHQTATSTPFLNFRKHEGHNWFLPDIKGGENGPVCLSDILMSQEWYREYQYSSSQFPI